MQVAWFSLPISNWRLLLIKLGFKKTKKYLNVIFIVKKNDKMKKSNKNIVQITIRRRSRLRRRLLHLSFLSPFSFCYFHPLLLLLPLNLLHLLLLVTTNLTLFFAMRVDYINTTLTLYYRSCCLFVKITWYKLWVQLTFIVCDYSVLFS